MAEYAPKAGLPTAIKHQKKKKKKERTFIITRICIGHSNLNYSLYIIGKSESDCCNYCGITETVEHVLLHCEAYNSQRKQFVEKLRDMEINDISVKNIFQNAQKKLRVYDFILKCLRDTDLIRRFFLFVCLFLNSI